MSCNEIAVRKGHVINNTVADRKCHYSLNILLYVIYVLNKYHVKYHIMDKWNAESKSTDQNTRVPGY